MTFSEIILNIIIISIPEVFFMVIISLLSIGRNDYIDMYTVKSNLKRIFFIVALPYSIISNYLLLKLNLDVSIRLLINCMVLSILMLFLLRLRHFKSIIMASILALSIVLVTEVVTLGILIYMFNFDVASLNTSVWINFLMTLPGRIIQFGLIYIIYLKRNAFLSIKILSIWYENKKVKNHIIISTFINGLMSLFIYNNFVVNRYIQPLNQNAQFYTIMLVFILLILNIICPYILIYTIYTSENKRKNLIVGGSNHETTY